MGGAAWEVEMAEGVPLSSGGDECSATLFCMAALVKELDTTKRPPKTEEAIAAWVEEWRWREHELSHGQRSWNWICTMITPAEIRLIQRLKPYRVAAEANPNAVVTRGWAARKRLFAMPGGVEHR